MMSLFPQVMSKKIKSQEFLIKDVISTMKIELHNGEQINKKGKKNYYHNKFTLLYFSKVTQESV